MKALIDGRWHPEVTPTSELRRRFAAEKQRYFRGRVIADPAASFPAAPGRYHLYVSYACPWAHRTILYRRLKGLEAVIGMSVLHPRWGGADGWTFRPGPHGTVDHAGGRGTLWEIYREAKPDFSGRVTVPVLWDRERRTIVNNESGEILRMLNRELDAWGRADVDYYPAPQRDAIDRLNRLILDQVCAGVYRAGFASSQTAYERAVLTLFAALDRLDTRLADSRPYLLGEQITESDWHLFATLCRFDAVYYPRLRCNLRRLVDYPHLSRYTRRLYEHPGVAETVRLDHVKMHYWDRIDEIDPRIVPMGPSEDFRHAA